MGEIDVNDVSAPIHSYCISSLKSNTCTVNSTPKRQLNENSCKTSLFFHLLAYIFSFSRCAIVYALILPVSQLPEK